jgi:hypothetical protein
MSRSIRSIAPALSLVFLLSAGAAHALPHPVVPSQPAGFFDVAWEWLAGLLAPTPGQEPAVADSRDKAGWELDPNGLQFVSKPNSTQTLAVQPAGCATDPKNCL